jgi:hypothetical protein
LAGRVDAVHLKDRYGEIESKTRAPIAGIVRVPLVMEVHPSVPAKTVAEPFSPAKRMSTLARYSHRSNMSGPAISAPWR